MKIDFLNLRDSNLTYMDALKEAACRVIDSGRYLCGEETERLEAEIGARLGVRHCIAVSTGLDAIRLIFRAYIEEGLLKPGDEVLYPSNTFIASILPVSELGLVPVPVPVSHRTHNIDFNRIEDFITPATKAVLLVHLYGTPCWDAEVCRRLKERGLLLIEDNAQALGALAATEGLHGSKACGALGDAAAISFYPTKNLGALGDAGMVVTSDEKLANTVRTLAAYGSDRRYHNVLKGYNNRIDELQAAFLRVKLPYLDEENSRRNEVAKAYAAAITHPDVSTPEMLDGTRQVWHQYVITTPKRDQLRKWLLSHGVASDIHYPIPPHAQPCYSEEIQPPRSKENNYESQPKVTHDAERLADSILSLPIANITQADAIAIADIINSFPG